MGDKRHTSPADGFQIIYVDIFPSRNRTHLFSVDCAYGFASEEYSMKAGEGGSNVAVRKPGNKCTIVIC